MAHGSKYLLVNENRWDVEKMSSRLDNGISNLHLWSQHLALTSAPTFEGFKRLEGGMGQRGKGNVNHKEEKGVLGESKLISIFNKEFG